MDTKFLRIFRDLCINEHSTGIESYYQKHSFTQPQMEDVMRSIMQGEATDAQIGALMMGLRMKVKVLMKSRQQHALCVSLPSRLMSLIFPIWSILSEQVVMVRNLFNVSTASSFVIAAAGATICQTW